MKNAICRGRRPRRPAKRIMSIILSVIMLLSITAGLDFSAYALASSGSCGTNATYTFDSSTGTLTISGIGAMSDFGDESHIYTDRIPWYNYRLDIESIRIEDSITRIGISAFDGCNNVTTISIGSSVTSIAKRAFNCCNNLTSVAIPDGVTSIGDWAFYGCKGLTSITITASVISIGSRAFGSCTGLTSVTISDSVKSIGTFAFSGCTGLTNITIGNNVTSIGSYAFEKCTGLTSVTISDSVKSIGDYAFKDCTGYTVYYTGSKAEWNSIEKNYTSISSSSIIYDAERPTCTHVYNNGTITTQPTCLKSGIKKQTCTVCGAIKTETVPALGHNYVAKVTKAATCTESGIKTFTCSRCSDRYSVTVNALGHDYKTTVKKATPKNNGYSDTVCSRCGDEHYKCIESPEVSLTQYVYNYDGKTKKPKVIVYRNGGYNSYLSKENYSIIYPKESKKLGTYTIKIVLKGAYYSGTFEESFRIQPKGVNAKKIKTMPYSKEKISVSWKKVKGVDGYIVYRWSNKKSKYVKYKKTKKTNIKIKRENKKTNQVDFAIATYKKQGKKTYESDLVCNYNWVKLSAPTFKTEQNEIKEFIMVFPYKDFYYIQWSNNSNFSVDDKDNNKNYWVKTGMYADKNNDPNKKTSRIRVFGLKANQTVYVRARKVYYNKKGKLVLGPWSKAKKVTVY